MKRDHFFRASAITVTFSIWALSLIPLSGGMQAIPGTDKIHHALAYFGCMFVWGLAYRAASSRLKIALLLIGMGALIECFQGLTPYRTFDWWDMVANTIGTILGWFAITLVLALGRKYPAVATLWQSS